MSQALIESVQRRLAATEDETEISETFDKLANQFAELVELVERAHERRMEHYELDALSARVNGHDQDR
jgi:hypothetical protein